MIHIKCIFSRAVFVIHLFTLFYAIFVGVTRGWPSASALILLSGAPCLQALLGFDELRVAYHKVRLPKTSALMLVGLAILLLTVDRSAFPMLWLGAGNVACFLLDTYWAKDDTETDATL